MLSETQDGGNGCEPTHWDLFAGMGGFSVAAAYAGYRTVLHCEINPFCQAVLGKRFPGVALIEDVNEITYDTLRSLGIGRPYIITGGVPCQPASIAGERKGAQDRRWQWPAFLRVVRECKPMWVLAENPAGLLSLEPPGFEWVTDELRKAGYEVWSWLFESGTHVGLPHARERVFIVGRLANTHSGTVGCWRLGWGVAQADNTGLADADRGRELQSEGLVADVWRWPLHSGECVADAGNGQFLQSWQGSQGRKGAGSTGASMVLCAAEQAGERWGRPCDAGGELEYANRPGQQVQRHHEPAGSELAASERASNCERQGQTQSGLGGAAHGLPVGLDRHLPVAGLGPDQYPWEAPRVLPPRTRGEGPDWRRERLAACGNGVVLQAAIAVMRAIKEADRC